MSKDYTFDSDRPEVIQAQGEAYVKRKLAHAEVLRARAQLHWTSQLVYSAGDALDSVIARLGCITLLVVGVIAMVVFFRPDVVTSIFGR